jgi:hypothetical protein
LKLNLSFWRNASIQRKRIYSFLLVFLVAVLAMVAGSFATLSQSQAESVSNNLNQTLTQHRANNDLTQYIFLNNFMICLLMFIPIAGAGLGLIILYDTGVALSAISTLQGYPPYIAILSLMATPVFWLEFAAYSIAMAESIWLFRRLLRKQWWELKWTAIFIGLCALILIIGAIVEVLIINLAG